MATVMQDLERARDRLEGVSDLARDLDGQAHELIEFLQTEVADWTAAIEDDVDFIHSTSAELKQRWSKLGERVETVRLHANEAWTTARNAAENGWVALDGAWRDVEPQFEELRQEESAFGELIESTRTAYRELDGRQQAATARAAEFIDADILARAQALADGLRTRSEAVREAMRTDLDAARAAVTDAGESLTARQQASSQQLSNLTTSFCVGLEESVRRFETRLRENADSLRAAATNTQQALTDAGQNISDTAATLMQGADDVADALNSTNVGLSTVVGIVNTGIAICEEIKDTWES